MFYGFYPGKITLFHYHLGMCFLFPSIFYKESKNSKVVHHHPSAPFIAPTPPPLFWGNPPNGGDVGRDLFPPKCPDYQPCFHDFVYFLLGGTRSLNVPGLKHHVSKIQGI